jgi:hypothetical protein
VLVAAAVVRRDRDYEERMAYNPETYWSRVGQEIEKRAGDNVVAGDDNPYYRYKRSRFLCRFSGYDRFPVEDNHGGRFRSGR